MNNLSKTIQRTWKSAQLYIGFHVDPSGKKRKTPKVWPPKNANATLHADPLQQETFVVLKNADGDAARDVQIKLRPDKIVLRRDYEDAWNGVLVTEHSVTVAVAGLSIRINHDGSITRKDGLDTTWVEADGSVLKKTEFVEASMSHDGVELSRRTPTDIAAIQRDGVLTKAR